LQNRKPGNCDREHMICSEPRRYLSHFEIAVCSGRSSISGKAKGGPRLRGACCQLGANCPSRAFVWRSVIHWHRPGLAFSLRATRKTFKTVSTIPAAIPTPRSSSW
jgi:hypothetical protein